MPDAVAHFLIPAILVAIFRDFFVNKKNFPLHYVFIAGLAGVLPDLDIAFGYLLNLFGNSGAEVHRTFSHSIFFGLVFVLIGLVFLSFNTKNKGLGKHKLKLHTVFFIISFGIFIHILLDATIDGTVFLLYPFSNLSVGLNLVQYLPKAIEDSFVSILDAVLLIFWMIYLEVRHKISDFI